MPRITVAVTIIPVLVSLFLKCRTGDRQPETDEDLGEAPEYGGRRLRRVGVGNGRGGGLARFLAGILLFALASALAIAVASRAGVLDEVPTSALPCSWLAWRCSGLCCCSGSCC
ncbi:MAG: hypothetical protein M3P70_14105 [Actinomycetota bacterium]|nr:hypothetical protein [Actinomycetota bacterium]